MDRQAGWGRYFRMLMKVSYPRSMVLLSGGIRVPIHCGEGSSKIDGSIAPTSETVKRVMAAIQARACG